MKLRFDMEKIIFTITVPQSKTRNPYALDASSRKAGKIKPRFEKRKNNPKKNRWIDE